MDDLRPIYAELAGRFEASFPARATSPRTVGRELEFPLVTRQGTAADVRRLWEGLSAPGDLKTKRDAGNPGLTVEVAGNEFSYTIEVGMGTMEVNTRPCAHLLEVKAIAERATARLVRAAAAHDWLVLGYGIQPVTPPAPALMTPKQRYQSLYRAMGEPWLWYTVTAADQVHVAIERDEAIPMLNFGNLIAPVLIALCANSPVWGGVASPYCSAREAQHVLIHANEHRHGMPARPFRDAEDFVARVAQATYLIRRSDNLVIPSARPFTDYLREHGADYEAFLFHEHYVWNSARVRAAYGTVELRPACQQPWREHMAASALGVGLICARAAVEEQIAGALGPEAWEIMRQYHRQAIRAGLDAPQPAPHFLRDLVGLAQAALEERGFGEEALLEPIYERLYRRENPAQRARRIFLTDGVAGLIAHTAIRPAQF